MRHILPLLWITACGKKDPVLFPDRMSLDFIAVDQTNHTLIRRDELYGNDWELDLPLGPRDIQLADPETVVVSHDKGAVKVDISTGEIVWEAPGYFDINGIIAQPDGSVTLVTSELNTLRLITVASNGDETGSQAYPQRPGVKIVRETSANELLFTYGEPWAFIQLDGLGNQMWGLQLPVQGYMAIREPDGLYYISTMANRQVIAVRRDGSRAATYDGAIDGDRFGLSRFAGFDVTDSRLVAVVNQADDPGAAKAVAYDITMKPVWSWADEDVGLVTNLVVLNEHYPE